MGQGSQTIDSEFLDACPVKDGFRLRGIQMTRTETFTDAAFAFAVTLLVISIDEIPRSYDELIGAVLGIPAFALSFVILLLFWYAHWQWSRRFGLEDLPTILLSFSLVFVVLCYVYPMKYLFNGMVTWITGGAVSSGQSSVTIQQLYSIFAIYGAGFVTLSGIIVLLNVHALRRKTHLALNRLECFDAKGEIWAWTIAASVGSISILLALLTPPSRFVLPGFVYMLMPIVMPTYGIVVGRRRKAMFAAELGDHG